MFLFIWVNFVIYKVKGKEEQKRKQKEEKWNVATADIIDF